MTHLEKYYQQTILANDILTWIQEGQGRKVFLLAYREPTKLAAWANFICSRFYFAFFFLGPYPRHMEIPRLGVELELQSRAHTTATATQDLSHVCDLHHGSRHRRILHPLSEARDWNCILMDPSRVR